MALQGASMEKMKILRDSLPEYQNKRQLVLQKVINDHRLLITFSSISLSRWMLLIRGGKTSITNSKIDAKKIKLSASLIEKC